MGTLQGLPLRIVPRGLSSSSDYVHRHWNTRSAAPCDSHILPLSFLETGKRIHPCPVKDALLQPTAPYDASLRSPLLGGRQTDCPRISPGQQFQKSRAIPGCKAGTGASPTSRTIEHQNSDQKSSGAASPSSRSRPVGANINLKCSRISFSCLRSRLRDIPVEDGQAPLSTWRLATCLHRAARRR